MASSVIEPGSRAKVFFEETEDNGLVVTIDTENLRLYSIKGPEDIDRYVSLYSYPEVIESFGKGYSEEDIKRFCSKWIKRWKLLNPFSSFSVFKQDEDTFIGHALFDYGYRAGQARIRGVGDPNYWGRRYGTEVSTALVWSYAKELVQRGYTLKGRALEEVMIIVNSNNSWACQIAEKTGMGVAAEEEVNKVLRLVYNIKMTTVLQRTV